MKFETNRLIIRNLQLSDIVSFHKMHSNPNVMKYTGDNIKTLKEDEADLERLIRSYSDKANDFWVWAIVKKADKQFIGTCAIINDADRLYNAAQYEIGFRFDEDYWGNGFASELTPSLIEFAFTNFGKTELMAEVDELNIASVKVIEKNMTYLKTHYNPKYQSNDRIYLIQKKMREIALKTAPEYYHPYINLAADKPFSETLLHAGINQYDEHLAQLEKLGDKVYAPGKWTVREIIQHCMDTERIFINRALRFVRMDKTNLPGYDHDSYVPVSRANEKSIQDLLEEYRAIRKASYLFFKGLNSDELARTGTANNKEISVLAIGFVLQGHPLHHFNVLKERYFGL